MTGESEWVSKIRAARAKRDANNKVVEKKKAEESEHYAIIPEQLERIRAIANGILPRVLGTMMEVLDDIRTSVSVEENDSVITVSGRISGDRYASNISASPGQEVCIRVFGPPGSPVYDNTFTLDTPDDAIERWFGEAMARFFEH
ncbi:MAG: hypothetical protein AB7O68_16895 [Pirellulales bacterium]